MKNDIKILKALLDKYRVSRPLPDEVQNHSLKNKRKNLIAILKKLKIYSPVFSLILSVFFFFKQFGITLSLLQSYVVLFIISVTATVTLAAGGYATAKILMINETKSHHMDSSVGDVKKSSEDKKINLSDAKKSSITVKGNIVYFQPLINNGADKGIVDNITNNIKSEIIKLKGKDKVSFHSSPGISKILLTGSVEKLDNFYMITLRVTNRMNRRIIFASSWEIKSENEMLPVCKKIARDISGKL